MSGLLLILLVTKSYRHQDLHRSIDTVKRQVNMSHHQEARYSAALKKTIATDRCSLIVQTEEKNEQNQLILSQRDEVYEKRLFY